jgi:hypothetical protein
MSDFLQVSGKTYLRKIGFLWGPVSGFPADVADDDNRIRFYRYKDLTKVLQDSRLLQSLIKSAIQSRQKIPYAIPPKSSSWILEVDNFFKSVSITTVPDAVT